MVVRAQFDRERDSLLRMDSSLTQRVGQTTDGIMTPNDARCIFNSSPTYSAVLLLRVCARATWNMRERACVHGLNETAEVAEKKTKRREEGRGEKVLLLCFAAAGEHAATQKRK